MTKKITPAKEVKKIVVDDSTVTITLPEDAKIVRGTYAGLKTNLCKLCVGGLTLHKTLCPQCLGTPVLKEELNG